jgi:spermidine/putrescine-binding protein
LFGRFQSPDWCTVDGQTYAVPLIWHTYPMVYNAGALPDPPSAWTDLTDPRFKGKIVMLDDVIGHFLTWNRALGAADPARVSYEKLDETVDTLLSIKRDQAMSYVGNLNDLAEDLASEGGWVTTTGQEIVPSLNEADGANLRLARPSPGDFSVCDCLCLPAEAPNLELAYDFIDHMISVDAQVALAGALYRGTVTEAAVPQLPDHARDLYRYNDLDSVFVASPLTGFPPLESEDGEIATYLDWVLAWDRIRVAPLQALSTPTPTPATTPVKS